jgi:hypothetical protein
VTCDGEGRDVLEITAGNVLEGLHEMCDGDGVLETGMVGGGVQERLRVAAGGDMEGTGLGGADLDASTNVDADNCLYYEHLGKVHGKETLTLAFQLSENSTISRNSSIRRISRRDVVQRSSPKTWCFRVFTAMTPHE